MKLNDSITMVIREVESHGWVFLWDTLVGPIYTNGTKKITLNRNRRWSRLNIKSVGVILRNCNKQKHMNDIYYY